MVEIHNTSMLLMCTLSTMQMFVSINNAHDPIAINCKACLTDVHFQNQRNKIYSKKVWECKINAWHSYFQNCSEKICPKQ